MDAKGGVTTYEYGPFDTLKSVTDDAGNRTEVYYDRYGRPRVILDPTTGHEARYYNAYGDILSVTDANQDTVESGGGWHRWNTER